MTGVQYEQIAALEQHKSETIIAVYEVLCISHDEHQKITTSFESEAIAFIVEHANHKTLLQEFFL